MSKRYRHIAHYYDAEYSGMRMLEEDVPFFLGQLPKRKQSILGVVCRDGSRCNSIGAGRA